MSASCGAAKIPNADLDNNPISATYPCDFKFDVDLVSSQSVLTPLAIGSFDGDATSSQIDITVEIENCKADSLEVEIINNGSVIYNESLGAQYLSRGMHTWQWDGFDNGNVLDTKVLKSEELEIAFIGTKNGISKKKTIQLNNYAYEVDWLDVKIDKNTNQAEVTIRPSFSDDGIEGTPPKGVTAVSYEDVKQLAKQGIEKYWSRTGNRAVSTPEGTYDVIVKVDYAEPSAKTFDLVRNYDEDPGRATSFWVFAKIDYNFGFYFDYFESVLPTKQQVVMRAKQYADENFKETAAHEIGHLILNDYGGTVDYSWIHKGSSSLAQNVNGNQPLPSSGEIDVMKYYSDSTDPVNNGHRIVADEYDVLSLFWLSGVKFND